MKTDRITPVSLYKGRITGVALYSEKHGLISLPEPFRHSHILALCILIGIDPEPCVPGFITSELDFVEEINR